MTKLIKTATILAMTLACAGVATADPKPQGAKSASPQLVANTLAGKTNNWKDCKGGIYYGGNWEAQAYCNRTGPAVGIGTWRVNSKGRLCHDLTWYWSEGDGVGSKVEPATDRDCHDHVMDANGTMWRSWGGDTQWWRLESSSNIVKGFKHKSKIQRLRKKLGV